MKSTSFVTFKKFELNVKNKEKSIRKKREIETSDNDSTTNEISTGHWTEFEHNKFLEGFLKYGRSWKQIQTLIQTRTTSQVRSHAQKYFKNKNNSILKPGRKKIIKKKDGKIFDIKRNKNGENSKEEESYDHYFMEYYKRLKYENFSNSNDFNFEMDYFNKTHIDDADIKQIEYDNIMYNN